MNVSQIFNALHKEAQDRSYIIQLDTIEQTTSLIKAVSTKEGAGRPNPPHYHKPELERTEV